jgi:TM2 domain-containing membrane protein YozV
MHDTGGKSQVDRGQNGQFIATISNYLREQSRQNIPCDSRKEQSREEYPGYPSGSPCSPYAAPEEGSFHKDPQKAALLSLIIPGLGQTYNGKADVGMEIAFATGMGLMLYIAPGILFWLYGVADAYLTSRKMNNQVIPYRHTTGLRMALVAVFSILCLAAAGYVIARMGIPGLMTIGLTMLGYNR